MFYVFVVLPCFIFSCICLVESIFCQHSRNLPHLTSTYDPPVGPGVAQGSDQQRHHSKQSLICATRWGRTAKEPEFPRGCSSNSFEGLFPHNTWQSKKVTAFTYNHAWSSTSKRNNRKSTMALRCSTKWLEPDAHGIGCQIEA